MSPTVLDTLIQVETPEAIDIQLRPASMFQRIIAFSLDLLIRGLWFTISTIVMAMIFGNLLMAAIIDNYGWFGLPVTPFGWRRLLGFALVLAGLALVFRR